MFPFRKATPRYAPSRPPLASGKPAAAAAATIASPFDRARGEWDERIGGATVQARNWRLMAFGCLAAALVSVGGNVYQASEQRRRQLSTYVVEVQPTGEVARVAHTDGVYEPSDAQIAYHLARFVEWVRAKPTDGVLLRQNWLRAYKFVTPHAAAQLNAKATEADPFQAVGKQARSVEVRSVLKQSDRSYQVRWHEETFENGLSQGASDWTGLFTVTIMPPRDERMLFDNPLGVFIESLSWSRDL